MYPVSATPKKAGKKLGNWALWMWYPIQVKQKDKVGRPDMDAFEAVMTGRTGRRDSSWRLISPAMP